MIETSHFGTSPDGIAVNLFTLSNSRGLVAGVCPFGATLTHLMVGDRKGSRDDVVLGFNTAAAYFQPHPYLGSTIGRVAGRVTPPEFTLGGKHHALSMNQPPHHLHGGFSGFDKRLWRAEIVDGAHGPTLRLSLQSAAGEEGYPGNVEVVVTYAVTESDALEIAYEARADQATPLSLTNHSYFNLRGESAGEAGLQHLQILADRYMPAGPDLSATGRVLPVMGESNDFRSPVRLSDRLGRLAGLHGDHYLLGPLAEQPVPRARLFDPASGRLMEVWTTEPCLQLYTGVALDGTIAGKTGRPYKTFAGVCLECQRYPGALHHTGFDSLIIGPGRPYRQVTQLRFSTRSEDQMPPGWPA